MTVNYYIGTKDKDTKDYRLNTDYFEFVIRNAFGKEYPLGFTITNSIGYFRHSDGKLVQEKSYIVTVLDTNTVSHTLICELKKFLNQESIGIQVINDVVTFE